MKGINPMNDAKRKTKLTDPERHKRFVEMARELSVAETAEVPQGVFKTIVTSSSSGKILRKRRDQNP